LREGIEYRGVLYFGLMLTKKGVSVLEYNVRFGDPETQVILPRLENDLVELMEATVAGRLKEIDLRWKQEKAVCVILASKGYPGPYQTGYAIRGLNKVEDVFVYHAGTKTSENGTIVTAGGRVLGLTGLGISFSEAREKVYRAAEVIEFSGKYFRQDIAGNLK
ncbi:MAG TPA: phosphoribosylglycinamide synthetase C domain-containing protein, partial [bacterium]|nr:phosphoribosylglycinamide synthetase C domain-containing protein [bacterium]